MKNKSILSLVLLLAGVLTVSTSCSDMLTPDLERYSEKSAGDSVYSYLGILKSMQKIVERDVIIGEVRGDLVSPTTYTSDSVSHLLNFDDVRDGDNGFLQCADYYNVINQCNFYLHYVDTADVKDEVKYMQKEWAQVQAMRAWAYLQLVQNYGEVPFFTEPVSSTSKGQEILKSGRTVSKDNIATLLMEAGLGRAYELEEQYGFPSYGSYYNGSVSIPSSSCFFPVALVTADLYLAQNDYENAADMFYKFIRDDAATTSPGQVGYSESIQQEGTYYIPYNGGWADNFDNYGKGPSNELITLIPGASTRAQGEVLIQVQNIYGFSTSITTSGGNSGSISLRPDETYRQLEPSEGYLSVNAAQDYCNYRSDGGTDVTEYYAGMGDGRQYYSQGLYRIDGEEYRFLGKRAPIRNANYDWQRRRTYAGGFSSYYAIPVYRKSLVYLRYAEALNRAGFPQHAFSILKDGICSDNYPLLRYKDSVDYHVTVTVDSLTSVTGEDSVVITRDTTQIDTLRDVPYLVRPEATAGGAYYISLNEMLKGAGKTYLDFTDSHFNNSANSVRGIHGHGCGETRGYRDTIYTYDNCVAKKIVAARADGAGMTDEAQTLMADSLAKVGIDSALVKGTYNITQEEVTNAVEDLIIDELALETAFEGNRYYDLMRFANHKGNGTIDNEWLAKKIASRGYAIGQGYDQALYGKLVGGTRWYLPLPEDK